MGIEVFLGEPPQHIKDWIINNSKPAANPKTKITFTDRTSQEYDWSGKINLDTMKVAGLYTNYTNNNKWVKMPQTIEIGTNVTSIGKDAFYKCSGLTSVTIPDSVTSIGNTAFEWCSGLTSVTIPDSVTSIGEYAFAYCSDLASVTIGNGVTSIGRSAFEICSSLTSVTIPDSVTSIGDWAFSQCSGLTSVTFSGKDNATVQGMANYSWSLKKGCVIHCTDGDITI